MKSLKILFLLTMLAAALAIPLSKGEPLPTPDDLEAEDHADVSASEGEEEEIPTSLRGIRSRFLGRGGVMMTCETNPRVCYVQGSPGPDCCKNRCVNLKIDTTNCGRCGKKCSYQKICCQGKCVNPMTNENHCGKCGNKCDQGSSCLYGMCSYA